MGPKGGAVDSFKIFVRVAAMCSVVGCAFLGLAACGDDSSSVSVEDDGSAGYVDSSSSRGALSSSSQTAAQKNSSSSKKADSAVEDEKSSSSSVNVPANWDWNVPRDDRLNPDIDYEEMVDERNDQTYKTVQIGNQVWMSQNLNFDYRDSTDGSICFSENEDYCKVGGRLYSWSMAQKVCPQGWHLPSRAEFQALIEFADSTAEFKNPNFYYSDKVSKFLKTLSGWNTTDGENVSGKDTYGFSALPTGSCSKKEKGKDKDGGLECFNDGQESVFWSSTESDGSHAYLMSVYYEGKSGITFNSKNTFAAVRCLKD